MCEISINDIKVIKLSDRKIRLDYLVGVYYNDNKLSEIELRSRYQDVSHNKQIVKTYHMMPVIHKILRHVSQKFSVKMRHLKLTPSANEVCIKGICVDRIIERIDITNEKIGRKLLIEKILE